MGKFTREVYEIESELTACLSWLRDYEREFRANSEGYLNIKRRIQSAERALNEFRKTDR